MSSTININTDDLTPDFIDRIKKLFPHKEVEILIYEQDDTDYLMSTEANKKHLLDAVKRIENKEGLIDIDPNNLP